jgi:uncharacterized protein
MRVNPWVVPSFAHPLRKRAEVAVPSLALLLVSVLCLPGCRSAGETSEVEVYVRGVTIDPASHSPVVVLEDRASGAQLPIWVGPTEARAILMRLEGVEAPRPMTHDLIKTMLDQTGVQFDRILIHALDGGTYYARIFLTADGGTVEIDSRPSDAIALAVRFDKPIFVTRALLQSEEVTAHGPPGSDALTVADVTVQALSSDLAEHFAIGPGHGVLVSAVGDQAGGDLQPGDVILAAGGEAVHSPAEFASMIHDASGKLDLFVQRRGTQVHVAFVPQER